MKKKIASGIAAISALTVLMAVNAGAAYAPEYREMIKQGSFQQYFKLHNDGQAEEGADAEDLISLYLFGKTEDSAVWAMVCPVVEKMTRAEFEVNDKKNQPMENIPTLKEPELLLLTEGKPELTMSGFQDEPSKIKVESIDNIERAAIKIEATSEAVDFFSAYPDIWTSDKDQSEGYAVELKKSENQYEKLCISVKYEGRRLILPYEVAAELLGLEIEDSVEAVTISFAKGKFEKDCSAFYAGIEQDDAGKDRYVFYQFDEGMYQVKKTGSSEKSRESSTENTSENTSEGQKPSSSLAQLSGIEPETETETIHISMEELLMMPEAKEAEDRKEAETENKKETEQATSEASAESETQTESENQTVTETEPQKETEQENGTEAETGTKKETEQETQTESETQTEAESE
ncbi:MAG: hypothetical protein Q4B01_09455, partial [Eubacteriales bacterium]|nr:hypothetical protein [Eubacteriales bacterium]